MDTFALCTTHALFLPNEEELLHLNDSLSSQDYEDLLLLPEPYELPKGTIYRPEHIVKITREGLLPEAEKLTEDINWGPLQSTFDRDERAASIDFTLCKAVRGRLALDLKLGELLTNLKMKGVDRLGYRSLGAFAVEHLSFSGRTASELMHNFELLKALPLTREAYLQGRIARSALRHLLRVITPENEAEWLSVAQKLSVSGLEREVKRALAGEKEPDAQMAGNCGMEPEAQGAPDEGLMMYLSVSPTLALTWDFALSFFRDREHYDGPLAGFVEALLANFLASRMGASAPSPLDARGNLPIFFRVPLLGRRERNGRLADQEAFKDKGGTLQENSGSEEEEGPDDNPWESPWDIFFPSWLYGEKDGEPVRVIAGMLIRAAAMRQKLDVATGMLLRGMEGRQLHRRFGFDFIEDYARERCGFSMAQTRQLIKLAEGFRRHSLTEGAFKRGVITREQARLILPLVDSKNESRWIAYAASVPTINLREETQRCTRILEYDCLVPVNYTLLPGFRYVTAERLHSLHEEVQESIRSGSWYTGPSLVSSWPLAEDDENFQATHDRRFDAPWKYFSNVDEMLACEASMKVENNSALCAGEICTIPQGANPEEIFLVDIHSAKAPSPAGAPSSPGTSSMRIKFFLPAELYEVWNTAALAFLQSIARAESPGASDDSLGAPEERFLAALLADYLTTEGTFHKAAHHHKILKRDRFRCQVPGCRCRRNLHVHHIIRRSQGGTDDPWNLITLCEAHHLHILHNLGTLTIKGRAPRPLTFTFGAPSDGEPFMVYEKGLKVGYLNVSAQSVR
ncbi:MAG: HNH endonuclease signature motif containing protein [Candidatus Eremiobacteraeota bacterium]|nr:HNH endonuclease signature motif containing protein [Candidatus Eremiobacteraeota bacterium]